MNKSVFFIAGEASGDSLGASLMRGLKKREGDLVKFSGIGGPLMEGQAASEAAQAYSRHC